MPPLPLEPMSACKPQRANAAAADFDLNRDTMSSAAARRRLLAAIVRTARAERRLSTAQFCAAAGLSRRTLATVEYGGRSSQATLAKLAAFLHVPLSELDPRDAEFTRRAPQPPSHGLASETDRLRDRLAEILEIRDLLFALTDEALALAHRLGVHGSESAGQASLATGQHGPTQVKKEPRERARLFRVKKGQARTLAVRDDNNR